QNANQDSRDAYQLANALSPELQYYRLSIIPNLASKVHQNIKAGYDKFAIFELGKSHVKGHGVQDDGLPIEIQTLGFVYSANDKKVTNDVGAAYFFAKRYLDYLANSLGLELDYALLTEDPVNEINRPFDWRRSALVTERNSGNYIGIVGELKSSVRKNLKLPQHTSGFEVLLDPVLESSRQVKSKSRYVPLAKFPRITQDLTLISPKELLVGDLVEVVIGLATSLSAEHRYIVNIDVRDIYHKQHSDKNHVTLRLNIYHKLRTLTTDEVNKFIDNLVKQASTKLPVKRDK
ncbi:hypothetical protein KDA11_06800, partial [Candidatus Saccharibacteria bacterium]|nr:hypothetical protein [Candidatus Saccharibacteria bacterium]